MKINLTLVRKTSQQPLISPFCPHIQIWFTWQTWLISLTLLSISLTHIQTRSLQTLLGDQSLTLSSKRCKKVEKKHISLLHTLLNHSAVKTRKPQNVKNLVFVSCAKKILMYNGVAETRFWCIMALQWGVSHDLMATISEIESSILPAPNCVSRVIHQKPKLGMQANTRSIQQTVLWSIPRKTWLQNTWKRRFLQNLDVART